PTPARTGSSDATAPPRHRGRWVVIVARHRAQRTSSPLLEARRRRAIVGFDPRPPTAAPSTSAITGGTVPPTSVRRAGTHGGCEPAPHLGDRSPPQRARAPAGQLRPAGWPDRRSSITTTSSQRPNFRPTSRSTPAI